MKRALSYGRVSTLDQGHNYSIPSQLEACRAYAQQHGFEVVAELSDTVSGAKLDRPNLSKLRQLVESGSVDVVIVYTHDRFTRSNAHWELLWEETIGRGVELHTVSMGEVNDTPEAKLNGTMVVGFAAYEREKFRERSMRGKKAKVQSGKPIGSAVATFGYRWEGVKRDKELVVNEVEAAVVRDMFRWYAVDGISTTEIAERLNAAGVAKAAATRARSDKHLAPQGGARSGAWVRTSINAILRNPTYKGEGKSKHGVVPVPAIVTPDLWQAAHDRLDVGRQRSKRNLKNFYLLRSLVKCSCGCSVQGKTRRFPGKDRVKFYGCYGRKAAHPGEKAYFLADRLEATVWGWVITSVLDEATIRAGVEAMRQISEGQTAALEKEAGAYQRQLDAATAQVTRLVQLYTADILTIDEVALQKKQIEVQRASAQTELDRVNRELRKVGPGPEDVEAAAHMAREVRAQLEAGEVSDETKRAVLEALDVRVVAHFATQEVELEARLTGDTTRLSVVSEERISSSRRMVGSGALSRANFRQPYCARYTHCTLISPILLAGSWW